MTELGSTTDPRALIPGYADAVTSTAAAMRSYAESLHEAGAGLKRIDTTEGWEGEAADGFRSAFDGEPTKWLQAGDAFHHAAEALEQHSTTLAWAQQQAIEAITLWNQGKAATNYARSQHDRAVEQAPPGTSPGQIPFHDPGEAKRQQARNVLDRARDQVATSGERAADVIGHARDEAPDRSWFEQAAGAVGDAAAATVNAAASLGNAMLHHHGMVAGLAGGAALTTVSAAGEVAGVALDATGAGAVAGVPLGGVSTAGIATGVGMMGVAMAGLGSEAAGDDSTEVVDTDDEAVEETTQDTTELTRSQQRAVESYEELIREHEEKLEAYKEDPDAYDNKGFLKNAPNEEIRQKIIDSRVNHLQKEIQTFRDNIDKVHRGEQ
ncbi:putative T7SS-secreted protein [Saccharopolyspora sp. MS10]|uniref:putative T7SS-secreted protein n=1 Tax=Saccharopolyspora sp. MS10 TaxID=3385973 RepID=UPI0039A23EF4